MSDIANRLQQLAANIRKEQDNTKKPPKTHAFPERPQTIHKWSERNQPKARPVTPEYTPSEQQTKQVFDANLTLYQLRDQIGRMQAILISNPAFENFLHAPLLALQEQLELVERLINEEPDSVPEEEREPFSRMKTDFFTALNEKPDDFF